MLSYVCTRKARRRKFVTLAHFGEIPEEEKTCFSSFAFWLSSLFFYSTLLQGLYPSLGPTGQGRGPAAPR